MRNSILLANLPVILANVPVLVTTACILLQVLHILLYEIPSPPNWCRTDVPLADLPAPSMGAQYRLPELSWTLEPPLHRAAQGLQQSPEAPRPSHPGLSQAETSSDDRRALGTGGVDDAVDGVVVDADDADEDLGRRADVVIHLDEGTETGQVHHAPVPLHDPLPEYLPQLRHVTEHTTHHPDLDLLLISPPRNEIQSVIK